MKTKEYMIEYRSGTIGSERIMVKLRNCPFCDFKPIIENMKIKCSLCGVSPDTGGGKLGCWNSIHEVRFDVNTWNGFLRYDENGHPDKSLYNEFKKIRKV